VINNAGIGTVGLQIKQLQDTFNTNFYGVKHMNDTMSPLLRDNGRIVNVSSSHATEALKYCSVTQNLQTTTNNFNQRLTY